MVWKACDADQIADACVDIPTQPQVLTERECSSGSSPQDRHEDQARYCWLIRRCGRQDVATDFIQNLVAGGITITPASSQSVRITKNAVASLRRLGNVAPLVWNHKRCGNSEGAQRPGCRLQQPSVLEGMGTIIPSVGPCQGFQGIFHCLEQLLPLDTNPLIGFAKRPVRLGGFVPDDAPEMQSSIGHGVVQAKILFQEIIQEVIAYAPPKFLVSQWRGQVRQGGQFEIGERTDEPGG